MTSQNKNFETTIALEGDISKRQRLVSVLLGRRGGNIQRICNTVGNGTYIRIYDKRAGRGGGKAFPPTKNTTIYISSKSAKALQTAALMLRQDMDSVLKGTRSSKPQIVVKVAKETIGVIIGTSGNSLRAITAFAGPGCFIVFKKELGGFLITGDTTREIGLAKSKIEQAEQEYFTTKREWNKRSKAKTSASAPKTSASKNNFSSLYSSDEESSGEEEESSGEESSGEEEELDLEIDVRKIQRNDRHQSQRPTVTTGKPSAHATKTVNYWKKLYNMQKTVQPTSFEIRKRVDEYIAQLPPSEKLSTTWGVSDEEDSDSDDSDDSE